MATEMVLETKKNRVNTDMRYSLLIFYFDFREWFVLQTKSEILTTMII